MKKKLLFLSLVTSIGVMAANSASAMLEGEFDEHMLQQNKRPHDETPVEHNWRRKILQRMWNDSAEIEQGKWDNARDRQFYDCGIEGLLEVIDVSRSQLAHYEGLLQRLGSVEHHNKSFSELIAYRSELLENAESRLAELLKK